MKTKSIGFTSLIIAIGSFFLSCSYAPSPKENLNDLKWLIGEWRGGNVAEVWVQVDENSFKGTGYYIKGDDTLSREHLHIRKLENYLVYISVVEKQPPVLFTLINDENKTWIFENKEHDFPQRIVYSHPKEGKLLAWIEGEQGGKVQKQEYKMEKVR